jgi:hypothetical protein
MEGGQVVELQGLLADDQAGRGLEELAAGLLDLAGVLLGRRPLVGRERVEVDGLDVVEVDPGVGAGRRGRPWRRPGRGAAPRAVDRVLT